MGGGGDDNKPILEQPPGLQMDDDEVGAAGGSANVNGVDCADEEVLEAVGEFSDTASTCTADSEEKGWGGKKGDGGWGMGTGIGGHSSGRSERFTSLKCCK